MAAASAPAPAPPPVLAPVTEDKFTPVSAGLDGVFNSRDVGARFPSKDVTSGSLKGAVKGVDVIPIGGDLGTFGGVFFRLWRGIDAGVLAAAIFDETDFDFEGSDTFVHSPSTSSSTPLMEPNEPSAESMVRYELELE